LRGGDQGDHAIGVTPPSGNTFPLTPTLSHGGERESMERVYLDGEEELGSGTFIGFAMTCMGSLRMGLARDDKKSDFAMIRKEIMILLLPNRRIPNA